MPSSAFKYQDDKYAVPENFVEYMEQHYLADRKLAFSRENISAFIAVVRYLKKTAPLFAEWAKANPSKIDNESALAIQEIVRLEGQKVNIMLAETPRDLSTKIPKGFSDETMLHLLSKVEDEQDVAVWREFYSPADTKHDETAAVQPAPKPLTLTDSTDSVSVVVTGVNTPHHLFSPTRVNAGNGTPTAAATSPTANAGTPHTLFSPTGTDTALSSPVARELEEAMKMQSGMTPSLGVSAVG